MTDRQTETYRQTGSQTDRERIVTARDIQTDRLTDRHRERENCDRQKHTDRQVHRQTQKERIVTDRQRHSYRPTDRETGR